MFSCVGIALINKDLICSQKIPKTSRILICCRYSYNKYFLLHNYYVIHEKPKIEAFFISNSVVITCNNSMIISPSFLWVWELNPKASKDLICTVFCNGFIVHKKSSVTITYFFKGQIHLGHSTIRAVCTLLHLNSKSNNLPFKIAKECYSTFVFLFFFSGWSFFD